MINALDMYVVHIQHNWMKKTEKTSKKFQWKANLLSDIITYIHQISWNFQEAPIQNVMMLIQSENLAQFLIKIAVFWHKFLIKIAVYFNPRDVRNCQNEV